MFNTVVDSLVGERRKEAAPDPARIEVAPTWLGPIEEVILHLSRPR